MVAAFQASETSILGYQGDPPFCRGYLLDGRVVEVDVQRFGERAEADWTDIRLFATFNGENLAHVLCSSKIGGSASHATAASTSSSGPGRCGTTAGVIAS